MSYAQMNRHKRSKMEIVESNETQHKLFNIMVRFPGRPYTPQLAMMSFIIQAILGKKNALLESPTGTGKTLALLCGALSAFESLPAAVAGAPYRMFYCVRTHSQLAQVVSELAKTSYRVRMVVLGARVRYCLNETAKLSSNIQHACSELRNNDDCGYYKTFKENAMGFDFPELPNDVWQLEHLKEYGSEHHMCPYYMTSVLSARAELIICPYQYVLNPRIGKMELGENDILLFDEAHNMEDASRDAFTRSMSYVSLHGALADMFSLFHRFPRFIVRYGLAFYVTYCTIQWMMQTEAKADSLMYMDAVKSTMSKYSLNDDEVISKLGNLISVIKNDRNVLRKAPENILAKEETIFEVLEEERHVAECQNTYPNIWRRLVNMLEFERFNCEDGKFDVNNYFLSHSLDDDETTVTTTIRLKHHSSGMLSMQTTETLKELVGFLRIVLSKDREGTIDPLRVSVTAAESNPLHKTVEMFTLDPSLIFKPLAESVRCVILASGTLSPFLSFESELGVKFPLRMEGSHVIKPEQQVCAMTLSYSASNYSLRCVYNQVTTERFQDELGETILALVRQIPQGVLCFFPSYTLMKSLRFRWMASGLWKRLGVLKELFCEPQDIAAFPSTIDRYYEAAATQKGAIMFGIFRGKCSEGMDFTDGKARAVISVGIPLPNLKDRVIEEKMRYNTIMQTTDTQRINGTEWYSLQAWRAVNQALGRCIRHIADYGCMILIDARFQDMKQSTSSDCKMLSRWIREHLVHEKSMMNAETRLGKFFVEKK